MRSDLTLFVISVLIGASCLYAQAEQAPTSAADASQSQNGRTFPLRVHGFLLGSYDVRMRDAHPTSEEGSRFLWADERLRLEATGDMASGHLSVLLKGDLFHDAVANELNGVVREAYVDASERQFDLRIGRQILTWGVGDLIFINDVFPKDWQAFFSGRPLEYLKLGVDAAKLHIATSVLNAEFVAIPYFQRDNLPPAGRFSFFDPFASISNRVLREPASTPGNTEFALRLYGRIADADVSLYAYRGYWRQPSFLPDQFPQPTRLNGFFPRLATYGASAQKNIGAGLLSLEAGYYDSRDDRVGTKPVIPNSQIRFLAGYQRQLATEFTLGAQYYTEFMKDYSANKATLPSGFPLQDRVRHMLTMRLTKFLKYQTWRLSLFSFYSPSDQDAMLIPELWHAFTDRLSLTVGTNIFTGQKRTTALGQYDRDSNLYLVLRYDF